MFAYYLPIVAEIARYDTVVQKMAVRVPLGIATAGSYQMKLEKLR